MTIIKTVTLAAALGTLGSVYAQAPAPVVNDYRTTTPANPAFNPSPDYRARPTESVLTKANKASSLVGMEVRNPQNQKLGDIKDIVLDLPSGRIAYAVLSVGGFLGIGDKYIAVPPNSFALSPDGKELILNADKARLESAPGFTKNSWPALTDPSWTAHSTYWGVQQPAVGTPAPYTTGRDTRGTLPNVNYESFVGRVVAIDGSKGTVTIEGPSGKHDFHFAAPVRSSTQPLQATPTLENLRVGEYVTARYYKHAGSYIAESITESHR